jgi:hypothetical protein
MSEEPPPDPLDNPEYLRSESHRLKKIIASLSDPEIRKELAAHSLYLAQRAEAIGRIVEDPAITQMNIERYRSTLQTEPDPAQRQAIQSLLNESEESLNAQDTLRELAGWYRSFAERAGSPAIWEARLHMAEDLEAEAERVERRNRAG